MKRTVSACLAAALAVAGMLAFSGCDVIGQLVLGATDAALEDLQSVDPNTFTTQKQQTVALDGVQEIELACNPTRDASGKPVIALVELTASPDAQLHLQTSANCDVPDSSMPTIQQDGNTLQISTGQTPSGTRLGSLNQGRALRVEVQVPKGYAGTLNTEVNAGILRADIIQTKQFHLELNAGAAEIERFQSAGDVRVNAGSVNIRNTALTGDLKLEVNAGAITCAMQRGSSFRFRGEKNAGALETYFSSRQKGSQNTISTTVGDTPQHLLEAHVNAGKLAITQTES